MAGIFLPAHTTDTTVEQYRRVIGVDMDGPFFLSQAAIPHLLESRGNIVNISSNPVIQGVPYAAAYGMSKGAVLQLTKSLAVEYIESPHAGERHRSGRLQHQHRGHGAVPRRAWTSTRPPVWPASGVWQSQEEVAALFAFLASDEAPSVTGAVYTIDNGITVS